MTNKVSPHLLDWLEGAYTHCQHGTKEWCEGYFKDAIDEIKRLRSPASDVNWHEDMENCPTDTRILIKYDSGDILVMSAEDNDRDWAIDFPLKRPKEADVDYPNAWAKL